MKNVCKNGTTSTLEETSVTEKRGEYFSQLNQKRFFIEENVMTFLLKARKHILIDLLINKLPRNFQYDYFYFDA